MDSATGGFRERTLRRFDKIVLNRAIQALHERGTTEEEIGELTGLPIGHVRRYTRLGEQFRESDDVWMIILSRELGFIDSEEMMRQLASFTYHTVVPAPGDTSENTPRGSGTVPMRAYQDGYSEPDGV